MYFLHVGLFSVILFLVDIKEAVLQLRNSLGDSQQAFATRLGISIRAVANYEKDRRPNYKSLTALENLARTKGQGVLANIFSDALKQEIDDRSGQVARIVLGIVKSQMDLEDMNTDELPPYLVEQVNHTHRLAAIAIRAFAKSDVSSDALKGPASVLAEFHQAMNRLVAAVDVAMKAQEAREEQAK